jgi:hypothetical protein
VTAEFKEVKFEEVRQHNRWQRLNWHRRHWLVQLASASVSTKGGELPRQGHQQVFRQLHRHQRCGFHDQLRRGSPRRIDNGQTPWDWEPAVRRGPC